MQENTRRVGCLGGLVAVLAACIGIGIFASVNESCDCATAAAARSSTVECSVGGSFGIRIRDRDYAEVCLSPGDTTTIEEEDVPEDVIVTCECNGTTEVCTDGTTTANAPACVPEEVEVTCECDGTTEVCSDGRSTENAVACTQPPALTGPLLTGEVITLCDSVNRPVNLRLVAGADTTLISNELTNGNLMVSIGGTDISNTCGVNPSNATLLTCTYPAGISSFPSPGLLTYNGNQIDSFNFYGENDCTPPPSTGGDTTNEEPDTCDPNEPGTPCFCEENPFDESCATQD